MQLRSMLRLEGVNGNQLKAEGLICAGNNEELMQASSLFLSATSWASFRPFFAYLTPGMRHTSFLILHKFSGWVTCPIGSAEAALPRHDSPMRNRPGQDFSYTVLHEGAVNFDSNACQLRKFAPVDFDSAQRPSVTLVTAP